MNNEVDVVIMWVDGGDQEWIKQRNAYLGRYLSENELKSLAKQYRNWDNLQYLLRGVERFMPWVRKVHLVTNGQKPVWLNEEAAKLNFVHHKDFMPADYLPTFSANPIELNIHRIPDLAERFIFFNDDMFVARPIRKEEFFSTDGLPKDQAVLFRTTSIDYDEVFGYFQLNDIGLINRNFKRNEVLRKYCAKFFSIRNGLLAPLLSATFLPTNHFPGFMVNHMPQPFLKSIFNEVWLKEKQVLHETSMRKFRNKNDVNQYLMREWQFASGKFHPTNLLKSSRYFSIFPEQLSQASVAIRSRKYRVICINDVKVGKFTETKKIINNALEDLLPGKSEYEI